MENEVLDQTQEAAPVDQQATETSGGEGQPQQSAQPDFVQFQQQLENINRELGQFRRAQGMIDKLPNMIDDRLTKWQKAQANNQLPPEERQQREQLEAQERALAEFSKKQALEAFKEAAKDYLPVIDKWKQSQEQQAFYSEFRELAGEQAEELEAAGQSVFEQISKDLDSGNEIKIEAAIRFMDKAKAGGPEFVLFHAQRELAKQQKANADGLVQNRVTQGKLASQSPKGKGAAQTTQRKRMDKMSQTELDALASSVTSEEFAEMLADDKKAAGIRE